ncbi:AzlC family ABC transporter permease [Streptomyces cavernicola]|uniref:AzlC family ABC transporter permease n=1 Tax=Streptomyces cavernicola TaxID=3043613 RepID=A0ABT6SAJ3_9ACTN|nr:AzlC family ABC transporter permease [Streptomyces sp. B-S-A6]MDI3405211.1 AzlC family ABC transporter permease [Streptomyces sp. B-S-A6]
MPIRTPVVGAPDRPVDPLPVATIPAPVAPPRAVTPPALSALKDSATVGLALVPLGLAFGVLVTQADLAWWWATAFSAFIYAGSFEFLLIGLVVAVAPLGTVALSAFLVNIRHVFYALSFPLHRVQGRTAKAYSTFALTDEAFALATGARARAWPGRRIVFLQLYMHLYWVGGATLGGLLGSLVPEGVTGLDFALTALFTVLALDAIRDRLHDLPTPALALLSAVIARVLTPSQMMLAACSLFAVALVVRHFASRHFAKRQPDDRLSADRRPADLIPADEMPAALVPADERPADLIPADDSPADRRSVERRPVDRARNPHA